MGDRTGIQWTDATWTTAIRQRFWSYVDERSDNECWPWKRGRFANGYGQFRVGKRKLKAHRIAYSLTLGPIANESILRHSCDNPPCCNPGHLIPGTHAENSADREARNRSNRKPLSPLLGETNPAAKLNSDQVEHIRRCADQGISQRTLARQYGMSQSQIGNIVRGQSWR